MQCVCVPLCNIRRLSVTTCGNVSISVYLNTQDLGVESLLDRGLIKKKLKDLKAIMEKARRNREKLEKQREKLRKKEQEQLQKQTRKSSRSSSDPPEGATD